MEFGENGVDRFQVLDIARKNDLAAQPLRQRHGAPSKGVPLIGIGDFWRPGLQHAGDP